MRGDRRVLRVRDGRDVDERVRPQRRADFVERDARDGEIGEERRIARDEIAEGARQRDVIGMDLERAGNGDQIGLPFAQNRGKPIVEFARIRRVAIGKTEKLDRAHRPGIASAARDSASRCAASPACAPSVATTTCTGRPSRRCSATRPPQPITSSSGCGASTRRRSPRKSCGSNGIASASGWSWHRIIGRSV